MQKSITRGAFRGFKNRFNFFQTPEDGQTLKYYGIRKIPSDDDDTPGAKPDEYVVDAAGNGDYTTISGALAALGNSSGTIRVLAGDYQITAPIVLEDNQTIIGSGHGTRVHTTANIILFNLSGANAMIQDIRVDGNNSGASQIGVLVKGDECTIRDCWITETGDYGIQVNSGADYLLIEGCRILDCSDTCLVGSGNYMMVNNCIIDNSSQSGIILTGDFCSIIGNKIMNHGEDGIELAAAHQATIVGNYIFSNGDNNNNGDGIELKTNCYDPCITGNIIHTNDGVGVDIQSGTQKCVVVGNSVLNNEDGSIIDAGTSTISGATFALNAC